MEGWVNPSQVEPGVSGYWTWDLLNESLLVNQLSYPGWDQHSTIIQYKIDVGSDEGIMPNHIFKILFPIARNE